MWSADELEYPEAEVSFYDEKRPSPVSNAGATDPEPNFGRVQSGQDRQRKRKRRLDQSGAGQHLCNKRLTTKHPLVNTGQFGSLSSIETVGDVFLYGISRDQNAYPEVNIGQIGMSGPSDDDDNDDDDEEAPFTSQDTGFHDSEEVDEMSCEQNAYSEVDTGQDDDEAPSTSQDGGFHESVEDPLPIEMEIYQPLSQLMASGGISPHYDNIPVENKTTTYCTFEDQDLVDKERREDQAYQNGEDYFNSMINKSPEEVLSYFNAYIVL